MNTTQIEVQAIPPILTLAQAAEISHFHERTLRRAIEDGALRAGKPTGNDLRILGQDLLAWVQSDQTARWDSSSWPTFPLHMLSGNVLDVTDNNPEDEGDILFPVRKVLRLSAEGRKVELVLTDGTTPPIPGSLIILPIDTPSDLWYIALRVKNVRPNISPKVLCESNLADDPQARFEQLLVSSEIDWAEFDHQVRMSRGVKLTGPFLAQTFLPNEEPTSGLYREISERMQRMGFKATRGSSGMSYSK